VTANFFTKSENLKENFEEKKKENFYV